MNINMNYQKENTKIRRTFVLEEESSNKTKVIPFEIHVQNDLVDLFPILSQALTELKNINFKIYDFKTNQYIEMSTLGTQYRLSASFFDNGSNVVLIKFGYNTQSQTLSVGSFMGESHIDTMDVRSETLSKKSKRSKQRVILEVIQIVKKWRRLCDNKSGISMTLVQAANKVGLLKKSLDDYYYQLRMGEKYQFDFHSHIYQKIGVLRSFLKRLKVNRKNQKRQKLANKLRIIDEINGYDNMIKQNSECQPNRPAQKIEQQNQQSPDQEHFKKQDLQKQFYRQFSFNMGKQMDHFMLHNQSNPMFNEENRYNNDFDIFF